MIAKPSIKEASISAALPVDRQLFVRKLTGNFPGVITETKRSNVSVHSLHILFADAVVRSLLHSNPNGTEMLDGTRTAGRSRSGQGILAQPFRGLGA
jgi:hypothetical protein